MKRWIALTLALTVLLSLAACHKNETDIDPDPPVVEEPVEPVEPQEPTEPVEPDDGEAQPQEPVNPEPSGDGVTVSEETREGQVEELVSYELVMPQVETGDAAVDQILKDYYDGVAAKLEDLCWYEVYEQALELHEIHHLSTDFTVERASDGILSIYRTVTVTDLVTNIAQTTAYSETFNLENGGLMTPADFFTVDEAAYANRLVDGVRRIIGEDPYHDQNYFAQWSDLAWNAFDKDQFFVTEDAYCVYYQENDLGGTAETVYRIPWDQLADITG